jgi:hypothetical protein
MHSLSWEQSEQTPKPSPGNCQQWPESHSSSAAQLSPSGNPSIEPASGLGTNPPPLDDSDDSLDDVLAGPSLLLELEVSSSTDGAPEEEDDSAPPLVPDPSSVACGSSLAAQAKAVRTMRTVDLE